MTITVYTKQHCPQCELTKQSFDILGIAYSTVDVEANPEAAQRFAAAGLRSLPIVETEDQVWAGHDQDKIRVLYEHQVLELN